MKEDNTAHSRMSNSEMSTFLSEEEAPPFLFLFALFDYGASSSNLPPFASYSFF